MGLYKHLRQTWQNLDPQIMRDRLIQWRQEPVVLRIEYPTRLDRARSLGYKAKLGYVLVRVRVHRGGRMREQFKGGRRSKTSRRVKVLSRSYQSVAEQRANKQFVNCEVLNSYFVAKDGISYWFECILVDRDHPSIKADPRMSWITSGKHQGRVYRGLTASEKRSRGLFQKGKGVEKHRPSQKANRRRAK